MMALSSSLRRGSTRASRLIRSSPTSQVERRSFFSRSSSSRSQSTSSGKGGNHDGASRAMSYFLDAQAACRNKRCRVGSGDFGITALPESCGEDSYFVGPNIVGVADGVGGWNENGVDPGQISRSLMRNAAAFVKNTPNNTAFSTLDVLSYGYAKAVADEKVEAGSTTACIVRLKVTDEGQPIVEYTNLGDSGFALIRDGDVIFRSKFQCYGRAPYQLAKIPPRFKSYGAIENQPEDSDSGVVEVQDGDIIVLATDGVWDNFSSDLQDSLAYFPPLLSWRHNWRGEISSLVSVIKENPSHAAQNIIKAAVRHNLKPDDVTVIVAKVVRVTPKL